MPEFPIIDRLIYPMIGQPHLLTVKNPSFFAGTYSLSYHKKQNSDQLKGEAMQLREILYVKVIAEECSFSKAAKRLYVTQSALSQSIRRLEDELGVKLFYRDKKQVSLTFAGTKFLEEGSVIIHLSEHLKRTMDDIRNSKSGELTIGISPFYQKIFLTRVLSAFQGQYPNVKLNVVDAFSHQQEKLLLRKKIELGIMVLPVNVDELSYEKLYDENILLALPVEHRCIKILPNQRKHRCSSTELSVLKSENFVMYKHGSRMWKSCMTICHMAGFEPHIVYETNGCESVNSAVIHNMGIGFVPMTVREVCPTEGAIYYVIDGKEGLRSVAIVYQEDELSHIGRDFICVAHKISDEIKAEIFNKI